MTARRRGSMGDAVARMKEIRNEERKGGSSEPATDDKTTPAVPKRRRITVYVRANLYAQARAAILELGQQGAEPASISALLDEALERELKRLAKKHRDGEPWPPHWGRLPGGRPEKPFRYKR